MTRKVRIPVTVISSSTSTAYMVFNIEGDTDEEIANNIDALEHMESEQMNEFVDWDIKPFVDIEKFPPVMKKMAVAHVLDAEYF